MKNLITALASVMILMMFVSQFAANEMTYIRMFAADRIISDYEEEWREGIKSGELNKYLDNNEIQKLKDELDRTFGGKVSLESFEYVCGKSQMTDSLTEKNGIYELELKIYDVIGPYKLIEGSVTENAALRKRRINLGSSTDTDMLTEK